MKIKRLLAVILTLVFFFTACAQTQGQKSGQSSVQTEQSASTPVAQTQMITKGADTSSKEKSSKAFTMGVLFSPQDTLDPATVTSPGGMVMLFAVYDSLATMSQEGVILRMAKSIDANADFTEYKVTLKDGIKFTDGTAVTGADVLASLKYLAASPMYQSVLGNLDPDKSKADGINVLLALKQPAADFIESSIAMFSPVAKNGEFKGIGAGAYSVEKGDPQTGFVLKVNENYYGGTPAIPQVTLLNVPDSSSKVKALQSGEIDYAWGLDGSAIQILSQEKDIEFPKGSLDGATALELVLNTRVEPFNDPEIRRAAKLAIDREKMVKTILGTYGVVGNDMLGKGFPSYPEEIEQVQMDKEEARRIFAQKAVKSFTIVSSDIVPGLNKATELMVQDFKDVGVDVHVEQVDPQAFFAKMGELYQKSAFTFYWLNRAPLAEFRSQVLKDSPYNVSGYFSDATEKNFAKATMTQESKALDEAVRSISKEIHELGGELIWGYQMDIAAKRKGFESPMTQSIPWLAEATFVPEAH